MVYGIGPARFRNLVEHFGDPQTVWEAPAGALRASGLSEKVVKNLIKIRASVDLQQVWGRLEAKGVNLLTWLDEGYPKRLLEVAQPPPVIYALGEFTPQDDWAVAIVGTRRVTPYGQQVTEEVASFLARNGVTVVSGLAKGVDAMAHRAALNAGGRTVSVLGSGIDEIYPAVNRGLAKEMMESGAVVSDYPLGTKPVAANFPPRNRIISGLARAVVIIEAGQKSGALITASFAAEQGREVFALPGNIYVPKSVGTNRLIQDGATPLLMPEDLLGVLDLAMRSEQQAARTILPSDPTEAALFAVLGHEPQHIDELTRQTDLPPSQVSSTLAMMELKGMVRQVGGMQYVAVREAQARYQTEIEN